jgi:MerR family transcriptional regulator, light-induced transcriptional regulator
MDDLINTRDVAEMAGVGPTAVKRWADTGALPCVRTAGGHRRFRRLEVERLLREHASGAAVDEVGRWLEALLREGEPRAVEARLLARRAALGAWHLAAEEVAGAVAEMGERWRAGQVSIIQEHLASERLARALARLVESVPVDPAAPRCLLACAEGDEHTLGLALAELCLREAGWMTLWAGRRTPVSELERLVDGVEMVALSASTASSDGRELRRQADAVGQACRAAGTSLLLGGGGRWPERLAYGARLETLEALHRVAAVERARCAGTRGPRGAR